MQTKPLVSCHGDQALFSTLHSKILQGLPKELIEWRRSYGRAAKMVQVDGSFVPYDEDILPNEGDRNLINRPFFHIFWTDCDLESYKSSVKEEIQEWHIALKQRAIPDWMIVITMNDEPKFKSKIGLRSSIVDKIRSDFCSKQTDRCVVLINPHKSDFKSMESWSNFYSKVRFFMLESYNRNLGRYEDSMRSFRERRIEPGWHFIEFFLVQEELAFIYEMIGVYDEALLQYDELDALFTQFVLNQATGSEASWLAKFLIPTSTYPCLSLARGIDHDTRDLIKLNKISILEFRNYLFSRQCAVLLLMRKPWEITQRATDYLHNTMHELHLMKVPIKRDVQVAWVFTSCLEVLQACDGFCKKAQLDSASSFTSSLHHTVSQSLKELGELLYLNPHCSLNERAQGEETAKHVLLHLKQYTPEGTLPNDTTLPLNKLKQALSSKEEFTRYFLELSEVALGTFKHIGRLRSARLIGLELAQFYMQLGDAHRAEPLLLDSMKAFKREGWMILADSVSVTLAQCQKTIGNKHKYSHSLSRVCSSETLNNDIKLLHFNSLLEISAQKDVLPYTLPLIAIATNPFVHVDQSTFNINSNITVTLSLFSNLPGKITADNVFVSLYHQDVISEPTDTSTSSVATSTSLKRLRSRNLSGPAMTFNPIHKQLPNQISLKFNADQLKGTNVASLTCPDAHQILKRNDSGPALPSDKPGLTEDKSSVIFTTADVIIHPGPNDILLHGTISQPGYYQVGHACLKMGHLDFRQPVTSFAPDYIHVVNNKPTVGIEPMNADCFVSGTQQKAVLHVNSGSNDIPDNSQLTLEPNQALTLCEGTSIILNSQSEMSEQTVSTTVKWPLSLFDHDFKIVLKPSWASEQTLTSDVTVKSPITVTHKIHTAANKKLIQVTVSGKGDTNSHQTTSGDLVLTSSNLTCTNDDRLHLQSLVSADHALTVGRNKTVHYVWLITHTKEKISSLDLLLTVNYHAHNDPGDNGQFFYKMNIHDFQTLYSITTNIQPVLKEDPFSQTEKPTIIQQPYELLQGEAYQLTFVITRVAPYAISTSELFLSYNIETDDKSWSLMGKSKGVLSLEDSMYRTSIQVTPLCCGILSLPTIYLSRYHSFDIAEDENENRYFGPDQIYVENLQDHVTVKSTIDSAVSENQKKTIFVT